jgi:hypothetical protein
MRTYEKIILTLVIITFWLPFIFQKSEIRLKGTESEYINQTPNLELMIIPYLLVTIWLIIILWRQKKIN